MTIPPFYAYRATPLYISINRTPFITSGDIVPSEGRRSSRQVSNEGGAVHRSPHGSRGSRCRVTQK